MIFQYRNGRFDLARRTLIIGIVNVTPDSFSDGGKFLSKDAAVAHALELVEQGADVLDIGGESTRPGAASLSAEEEIARVVPVIESLSLQMQTPISVDTTKAEVASAATCAGAAIVNDISSFRFDPQMAEVVRGSASGVILMHMQGTPRTMQANPKYQDVVTEVREFLQERVQFAMAHGIPADRIMVDPGIGFGKTVEHNLELLRGLTHLRTLSHPLLVGTSRKSFIGAVLGRPLEERDWGTAATAAFAIAQGAHAIRVHDVKLCQQVARMTDAVLHGVASEK